MTTPLYSHPARIEINLKQFQTNIQIIRAHIGKTKLCLPAKANAYGHGLVPIAKAAIEAGVDVLAVSCLQEAFWLREAKIEQPILVFGAIHEDQIEQLIDLDVEITIASQWKANLVAAVCQKLGKRCKIHIEVDTGMQRTGVRPSTALGLFQQMKESRYFDVVGVYSHFASANSPQDPIALKQIERFFGLYSQLGLKDSSVICHLANSGGVTYFPESHLDMVRPGILAFGYADDQAPPSLRQVAPCFTLKAKISYTKVVGKNEGISYGHTFITDEQTRIATVPIGYGDGYRRSLSNVGSVLLRGKKYPIVGNVCMDQFMINVGKDDAYVGDEVVLIGRQGDQEITLQEISQLCNTVPHEILSLFNERIPRIYILTNVP
jgi:alanine racemase